MSRRGWSVCRTRRASSTTTDRHEDGRIFGAEWGHILVALVLAAVLIWRMARQKTTQRDSPKASHQCRTTVAARASLMRRCSDRRDAMVKPFGGRATTPCARSSIVTARQLRSTALVPVGTKSTASAKPRRTRPRVRHAGPSSGSSRGRLTRRLNRSPTRQRGQHDASQSLSVGSSLSPPRSPRSSRYTMCPRASQARPCHADTEENCQFVGLSWGNTHILYL